MTNNNPAQDDMNERDSNALDRELDAALAKYRAIEPRAGLADRVLANLRAEQGHATARSWRRWPAVTALAAVIVLAISVAWRSWKPAQSVTIQSPPVTVRTNGHAGMQLAKVSPSRSTQTRQAASGMKFKPQRVGHPLAVTPDPKLDQFPSPRPLSNQEKILAEYVAEHHQQAVLIARVRMADLKDWAEETEAASTLDHP